MNELVLPPELSRHERHFEWNDGYFLDLKAIENRKPQVTENTGLRRTILSVATHLVATVPITLQRREEGTTGFWKIDVSVQHNFLVGGNYHLVLLASDANGTDDQTSLLDWFCDAADPNQKACIDGSRSTKNQVSLRSNLSPGKYKLGLFYRADQLWNPIGGNLSVLESTTCSRFGMDVRVQYHPSVNDNRYEEAALREYGMSMFHRGEKGGCDGDSLPTDFNSGGMLHQSPNSRFFDKKIRFDSESLSQVSHLHVEVPSLFRIVVSHPKLQFDIEVKGVGMNATYQVPRQSGRATTKSVDDSGLFLHLPKGNFTVSISLAEHLVLDKLCELVTVGMAISHAPENKAMRRCPSERETFPDASFVEHAVTGNTMQIAQTASRRLLSSRKHCTCTFSPGFDFESDSDNDVAHFAASEKKECCDAILSGRYPATAFVFRKGGCYMKKKAKNQFRSAFDGEIATGVAIKCPSLPSGVTPKSTTSKPNVATLKDAVVTEKLKSSTSTFKNGVNMELEKPKSSTSIFKNGVNMEPPNTTDAAKAQPITTPINIEDDFSGASVTSTDGNESLLLGQPNVYCVGVTSEIRKELKTYTFQVEQPSVFKATMELEFLYVDIQVRLLRMSSRQVGSNVEHEWATHLWQQPTLEKRVLRASVSPGHYKLVLVSGLAGTQPKVTQKLMGGGSFTLDVLVEPVTVSKEKRCPEFPPIPSSLLHGLPLDREGDLSHLTGRYRVPPLQSVYGAHRGTASMSINTGERVLLTAESFHSEEGDMILLEINKAGNSSQPRRLITRASQIQYVREILEAKVDYVLTVTYEIPNDEYHARTEPCLYIDLQVALAPVPSDFKPTPPLPPLMVPTKPPTPPTVGLFGSIIQPQPEACVKAVVMKFPLPPRYSFEESLDYEKPTNCSSLRVYSFYVMDKLTEFRASLRFDFSAIGLELRLARVVYDITTGSYLDETFMTSRMNLNRQEISSRLLPTGSYRLQVIDLNFNSSYPTIAANESYTISATWFEKIVAHPNPSHEACYGSYDMNENMTSSSEALETFSTLGEDEIQVIRYFPTPSKWIGQSFQLQVQIDQPSYFRMLIPRGSMRSSKAIISVFNKGLSEGASNVVLDQYMKSNEYLGYLKVLNYRKTHPIKRNNFHFAPSQEATGLAGRFVEPGMYTIQVWIGNNRSPPTLFGGTDCPPVVPFMLYVRSTTTAMKALPLPSLKDRTEDQPCNTPKNTYVHNNGSVWMQHNSTYHKTVYRRICKDPSKILPAVADSGDQSILHTLNFNVTDNEALFSMELGFDFLYGSMQAKLVGPIGSHTETTRYASLHENQVTFAEEVLPQGLYNFTIFDPFEHPLAQDFKDQYVLVHDTPRPLLGSGTDDCLCLPYRVSYLLLPHRSSPRKPVLSHSNNVGHSVGCPPNTILPTSLDLTSNADPWTRVMGGAQSATNGSIYLFSDKLGIANIAQDTDIRFKIPQGIFLKVYAQTDEPDYKLNLILYSNGAQSKKPQYIIQSSTQNSVDGILDTSVTLHSTLSQQGGTSVLTLSIEPPPSISRCAYLTLMVVMEPYDSMKELISCEKPGIDLKPRNINTSVATSFVTINRHQSLEVSSAVGKDAIGTWVVAETHDGRKVQRYRIPIQVLGDPQSADMAEVSAVVGYTPALPDFNLFLRSLSAGGTIARSLHIPSGPTFPVPGDKPELSVVDNRNVYSSPEVTFGAILEATVLPGDYYLDIEIDFFTKPALVGMSVKTPCVPFIFNMDVSTSVHNAVDADKPVLRAVHPRQGFDLDALEDFHVSIEFSHQALLSNVSANIFHVLHQHSAPIWLSPLDAANSLPLYPTALRFATDLMTVTAKFDHTKLRTGVGYRLHISADRFQTPDNRPFSLRLEKEEGVQGGTDKHHRHFSNKRTYVHEDLVYHFSIASDKHKLPDPYLGLGLAAAAHINDCRTRDGYHLVGHKCVEHSQCTTNTCNDHGLCSQEDGSVVCQCDEGFVNAGDTFCAACDSPYATYPNCSTPDLDNHYSREQSANKCGALLVPASLDVAGALLETQSVHLMETYYLAYGTEMQKITFTIKHKSMFRVYLSNRQGTWKPINLLHGDATSPPRFKSVRLYKGDDEVAEGRRLFGGQEISLVDVIEADAGLYTLVLEVNPKAWSEYEPCPQFVMELAIDSMSALGLPKSSPEPLKNVLPDINVTSAEDNILVIPAGGFNYSSPSGLLQAHSNMTDRIVYKLAFRIPHLVDVQAYVNAALNFKFLTGQLRLALFDNNLADKSYGWLGEMIQNRDSLRLPLLPGEYELLVYAPVELDPKISNVVQYDLTFNVNFVSAPKNINYLAEHNILQEECSLERLPIHLNVPEYLGEKGTHLHLHGKFRREEMKMIHETRFQLPRLHAGAGYGFRAYVPIQLDQLSMESLTLVDEDQQEFGSMSSLTSDAFSAAIKPGSYILRFQFRVDMAESLLTVEEDCSSFVLELSIVPLNELVTNCAAGVTNAPEIPAVPTIPFTSRQNSLLPYSATLDRYQWDIEKVAEFSFEVKYKDTLLEITAESDFSLAPLEVVLERASANSSRSLLSQPTLGRQIRQNLQSITAVVAPGKYHVYLKLLAPLEFEWHADETSNEVCIPYHFNLQLIEHAKEPTYQTCIDTGSQILPAFYNTVESIGVGVSGDDSGHMFGHFLLPSVLYDKQQQRFQSDRVNLVSPGATNSSSIRPLEMWMRFSLNTLSLIRIALNLPETSMWHVRLLEYPCPTLNISDLQSHLAPSCNSRVLVESYRDQLTIAQFLPSSIYELQIRELRPDMKFTTPCPTFDLEFAVKSFSKLRSLSSSASSTCEHDTRGVGSDHWAPRPPLHINRDYHYDSVVSGETLYFQQRANEPRTEDLAFKVASPFRLYAEVTFDFLTGDLGMELSSLRIPDDMFENVTLDSLGTQEENGHFAISAKDQATFMDVVYEDEMDGGTNGTRSMSHRKLPKSPLETVSTGFSHPNRHVIALSYLPAGDYMLSIFEPGSSLVGSSWSEGSLGTGYGHQHLGWFCPRFTFRLHIQPIEKEIYDLGGTHTGVTHGRGSAVILPSKDMLVALPQYHPLPSSLDSIGLLHPSGETHFFSTFSLYPSSTHANNTEGPVKGKNSMTFEVKRKSFLRFFIAPHSTWKGSQTHQYSTVLVGEKNNFVRTFESGHRHHDKAAHLGFCSGLILEPDTYTLIINPVPTAVTPSWSTREINEAELEFALKPLDDFMHMNDPDCISKDSQGQNCLEDAHPFVQTPDDPNFSYEDVRMRLCHLKRGQEAHNFKITVNALSGILLQLGYQFLDNHMVSYLENLDTNQRWLSSQSKNMNELYAVVPPGKYAVTVMSMGEFPTALKDKCIHDHYSLSLHMHNLSNVFQKVTPAISGAPSNALFSETAASNQKTAQSMAAAAADCEDQIALPECLLCSTHRIPSVPSFYHVRSADKRTAYLHGEKFGFGPVMEDRTSLMEIKVVEDSFLKVQSEISSPGSVISLGVLLNAEETLTPVFRSQSLKQAHYAWKLEAEKTYYFAVSASAVATEGSVCPMFAIDVVVTPLKEAKSLMEMSTNAGCSEKLPSNTVNLGSDGKGVQSLSQGTWNRNTRGNFNISLTLQKASIVSAKLKHSFSAAVFHIAVLKAVANRKEVVMMSNEHTVPQHPATNTQNAESGPILSVMDTEARLEGMLEKGTYTVFVSEQMGEFLGELYSKGNADPFCYGFSWELVIENISGEGEEPIQEQTPPVGTNVELCYSWSCGCREIDLGWRAGMTGLDIVPPSTVTCTPIGACSARAAKPSCQCPPGFAGERCQRCEKGFGDYPKCSKKKDKPDSTWSGSYAGKNCTVAHSPYYCIHSSPKCIILTFSSFIFSADLLAPNEDPTKKHKKVDCDHDCGSGGVCNRKTGRCMCRPGYSGPACLKEMDAVEERLEHALREFRQYDSVQATMTYAAVYGIGVLFVLSILFHLKRWSSAGSLADFCCCFTRLQQEGRRRRDPLKRHLYRQV